MWPSASSRSAETLRFVVLGVPECRRVALFQAALSRRNAAPAVVVPWSDWLDGRVPLHEVIRPGDVMRIETPGRSFEVERALLALGAAEPEDGFARAPASHIETLSDERGLIRWPRQWYLGFRRALHRIDQELVEAASHRATHAPAEIATMFDKPACHARLLRGGVPVPRCLGKVGGFEELRERMRTSGIQRVFVKLAHGSSASGIAAYQCSGQREQAVSTTELVPSGGELRLYNTRRLRLYQEGREIAELIDALCRHRVHVEEWLPKAGFAGQAFDLRVVVIGGRCRHVVPRLSRTPMTNLHLLNRRGDLETLLNRMPPGQWEAVRETCERAARQFPGSLTAGIDLLIAPGFRRHAVAEVNAFGDLLPGILHEGLDTYEAQVEAMTGARALVGAA
jgi:hypothetical protein